MTLLFAFLMLTAVVTKDGMYVSAPEPVHPEGYDMAGVVYRGR